MTAALPVVGPDALLVELLAWRGHARLRSKRRAAALDRIIDSLAALADDYHDKLRRGDQAVEAVHMLHDQAHDHAFVACLLEPCRHITARPGDRLRGPAPLHLPLVPEDAS